MNRRTLSALASLYFSFLLLSQAPQSQAESSEAFTPHYAFSNYFGAGFYSSTGQGITVFNMPFDYEPEQEGRNRYRIRLPVSLGYYNFQFDKLDDIKPIKDAATLTLTFGIEFDHWLNDNTKLVPFLDMGYSENFSGKDGAVIYASGLSAYNYFQGWGEEHTWLVRLQRAGYRTNKNAVTDGFSSFELGVDLKWSYRTRWFERDLYFTNYAIAYWYMLDIAFNPESIDPASETSAQEV
ncbi:MAG: hypothetical protein KAG18_06555, partial [Sinobacterium sp.]|nr:hypothetical protein [Sinobacterium sp.]